MRKFALLFALALGASADVVTITTENGTTSVVSSGQSQAVATYIYEYSDTSYRRLRAICLNERVAEACNELGVRYYEGDGVKRSYANAKKYLKKACTMGLATGCDNYRDVVANAKNRRVVVRRIVREPQMPPREYGAPRANVEFGQNPNKPPKPSENPNAKPPKAGENPPQKGNLPAGAKNPKDAPKSGHNPAVKITPANPAPKAKIEPCPPGQVCISAGAGISYRSK